MRTEYFWTQPPSDIIIDPDGQVWVATQTLYWYATYQRIEEVRADHDSAGSFRQDTSGRCGRPSGCSTHGHTGSYHYLVDEDRVYEPKPSPPLISDSLWQASLYQTIQGKDDGIRNFQGWDF